MSVCEPCDCDVCPAGVFYGAVLNQERGFKDLALVLPVCCSFLAMVFSSF